MVRPDTLAMSPAFGVVTIDPPDARGLLEKTFPFGHGDPSGAAKVTTKDRSEKPETRPITPG
jgi:hypothetical protein